MTALRNLEFELNEGDKIGLLGHDEPEKSTLLRTRVEAFVPTHGRVNVPRTVESLIEIALGINLEATGRENVFLLGRLLGMTKAEIEQSYGAFDEFTELGDFMELQMMAYSSEMQLRLAFAVATMATSDIWSWTSGCPRKVKTFRF